MNPRTPVCLNCSTHIYLHFLSLLCGNIQQLLAPHRMSSTVSSINFLLPLTYFIAIHRSIFDLSIRFGMTRLLNYNFQTFCRQIVFLVWVHHLPERHGRPPAVACLEPPPGNVPMIGSTQPNTISENRYLLYNNISMLSTTFQYYPTMTRITMATMMMERLLKQQR